MLAVARQFPSSENSLRPLTADTLLVLAYCTGLRLGELVGLTLGDIHCEEESIYVRDTKFFKSRCVPIRPSVMEAIKT